MGSGSAGYRGFLVEFKEAVEGPVKELVPAGIPKSAALHKEISKAEPKVKGWHRKPQVDFTLARLVELLVGLAHDLPRQCGSKTLCANWPDHRLHGGYDLKPGTTQVIDD
jgi:hypothetical protein